MNSFASDFSFMSSAKMLRTSQGNLLACGLKTKSNVSTKTELIQASITFMRQKTQYNNIIYLKLVYTFGANPSESKVFREN